MASNCQFLASQLTIHTPHSQLGRVPIPATVSVGEGDEDEDDAISVSSSQVPSQVASHPRPPISNHVTRGPPTQHLVENEWTTPFYCWLNV